MKLSLQLKLGQQLTMTPQLQQAIKLLQLSTLDLQQEIQEVLESNPMLELDEDFDSPAQDAGKDSPFDFNNAPQSTSEGAARDEFDEAPDFSPEQNWNEHDIPEQLAVDGSWDDIYINGGTHLGHNGEGEEFENSFEERNSVDETLQDHLLWQLNLTPMSDRDRLIALALIDAIDVNGQLASPLDSIRSGLAAELDIEEDEVLAVLHRIQQFDPVGVGYRDTRECLSIQLKQLDRQAYPGIDIAEKIVANHLGELASRDYNHIMRNLRIREPELKRAVDIIRGLNPRPGAGITPAETTYIVPDVFVSKHNGEWKVELNPDTAPRIRVNPQYAALTRSGRDSDNAFLRDSLQEARWFIKSLQSRNDTLLKVATRIVEHQKEFLEHGEEAMKPLVLHDIATLVQMHESTISRVTTQKYMHTPRGIFELKYFFSSHIDTDAGGECSSVAIRAVIKKLVAAENPKKPLSDSKIADLLAEQGIQVARRTIAKYREVLAIAPSNERKQLM
ncbi:MAG: RNA polymerase factor sigma-54 [Pseudomonadales bacterium]|jgi:RNA polymerase sigma-54 factor|nr:RNA polymerase factor sigma-54 [Pseudomonadales bacterium]